MNEIWWGWSWILMSINLTAMILAGRKLWQAWLVGVAAEMMWIAYGYATEQWGLLSLGLSLVLSTYATPISGGHRRKTTTEE